jgi:hypothetical protein|tara:strand:- start:11763 stop:13037 length:1275 start_codon:yes stop_codon:yes gene_type:complete
MRLTLHSISKLLDKLNTFPCTQSIEEGTLALGETAEYRTDKDLYHVIRLQRIIENIESIASATGPDADAHEAYLRVRAELEEFRVYLCSDVSDSRKSALCSTRRMLADHVADLLFMQFHTAKLFLYQVAFFERNLQQSPALHLNILCEGLEGAKSFLDLYLWLPPKSEMNLTNSEWIQLSFGVTLAAKFAIISKEPGVEPRTRDLRHRLNIDNVFRHLALRIGALVGRAGEGNKQKDIFFHYEQRVRKIQKWYERMIRATGADSPTPQPAALPPRAPSASHQGTSPSQQHGPYNHPPSATPSHVPVSTTFSHQQPQGYSQPISYPHDTSPSSSYQHLPQQMHSQQMQPQQSMAAMGMAPMSTYSSYSPVPTIAYPDLMNAQGWDNMFSIPMEHDGLIFDVSQGYGLGMASPPSDVSTWDSPTPQ